MSDFWIIWPPEIRNSGSRQFKILYPVGRYLPEAGRYAHSGVLERGRYEQYQPVLKWGRHDLQSYRQPGGGQPAGHRDSGQAENVEAAGETSGRGPHRLTPSAEGDGFLPELWSGNGCGWCDQAVDFRPDAAKLDLHLAPQALGINIVGG